MKRLAAIGILCMATGAVAADGPAASQPAVVKSAAATETALTQRTNADEERLKAAIKRAQALADLDIDISRLKDEMGRSQKARDSQRGKLLELTGRSDEKGVLDAIRELEDAREKALLAWDMKGARENLIQAKVESISKETEKKSADDKITKELSNIVAAREKGATDAAVIGTVQEVDAAKAAAAEARLHLVERQEAIATAVYGDTLRMLNEELVKVSLDADEQRELVGTLESRLKTLWQARAICDAILADEETMKRLQGEVERLMAKRRELEETYNSSRP